MIKTYLESEELELLELSATNPRDRLLIRLLSRLGCRVSEALAISVDDIDFQESVVTIQHLKVRLKLACPYCSVRLAAIRESRFSVLFYTAFSTGLRLGELLALTWRDIDLERCFLSVTKAFTKRSGVIEIREPKTTYSRRRIDMSASLVRLLREHRHGEQARGDMLDRPLEETDLVFCNPVNRPLDPSTVSRSFTRVIRQAGLPYLNFHGLRHTHASLLIASGLDIKTVSARLGHASTSFTLDVYGHVLPGILGLKMLAKDLKLDSEPQRTRTSNLLIKSQLLCQLS